MIDCIFYRPTNFHISPDMDVLFYIVKKLGASKLKPNRLEVLNAVSKYLTQLLYSNFVAISKIPEDDENRLQPTIFI